jgi:hypothetical protein
MSMKVVCNTGEKKTLLFYKVVVTGGLYVAKKAKYLEREEKLFFYLNEMQQFGYAVSSEMCQLKAIKIS